MILLDTHVIIWLLSDPDRISSTATHAILQSEAQGAGLGISSVSLYEIARAVIRGRIKVDLPLDSFLERLEADSWSFRSRRKRRSWGLDFPIPFPGTHATGS